MNVILAEAAKECKGPKTMEKVQHPSCRAFMDDLTAMTAKEIGMRWILRRLDTLATWGGLKFKPKKSRSLLIKGGKVFNARFKVQGELIPTLSENPIRSLGKWFDASLTKKHKFKDTQSQLEAWLVAINEAPLPGNLKVWCFEFGVLPRLSWPFHFQLRSLKRWRGRLVDF